jgi:crotonobetainyl-CoA:carnitine CoA-transferase CaiB-like acyl-CoA transferase
MTLLQGLRVLDLSPTRVGAQLGQVFADLGAEVCWVEPPAGSALRGESAFPFWARGKQSVVADLRTEVGRATVRDLAAASDVLIETFRPGVMERHGLGYEELRLLNSGLVYASVTGFGRQGPFAAIKGYEGIVYAKLGVFQAFQRMTSRPGPAFVSAPFASFAATQTTLHGVLAALFERERSGVGQHVEGSLAQGFSALDTWQWFVHLVRERFPDAYQPSEQFDADGVPVGAFPFMLLVTLTSDGRWLQFAQVAPHLFAAFMKALGLGHMLGDPEWAGIPAFDDIERRTELWDRMLTASNAKTLAEWEAIFDADPDVFAEAYRGGPDILEHPQLVYDGHTVDIADPRLGIVRQPGLLVHEEGRRDEIDFVAPDLGSGQPAQEPAPPAASAGAADGDAATGLPLEGVTILELAGLFAAPFGTTLLTDLGARVIHVEPLSGDPIRPMMVFPETAGVKVMQGKESICVDITTPEGLEIIHRIVERCDVVMQGFRAGVARRLGVDSATLLGINPELVYLNAPGYGTGGPDGHRPAYAPSIGAAGGIGRTNVGSSVVERPGQSLDEIKDGARRMSSGTTITQATADGLAALGVATAILVGLVGRARGQDVPPLLTTMLSTASHAMSAQAVDYPGSSGPLVADTALRGYHARYRIYDASDGWVFLAAPGESEWASLVAALRDHVDLDRDPRFTTEQNRVEHDDALTETLTAVFVTRGKGEWERDLLAADVACVAVSTEAIESVLMSDAVGRASGYVVDVVHPVFDEHPRLAPVVRFSRSATRAGAGVLAGAQTNAVLSELGYDDAALADLHARNVIR